MAQVLPFKRQGSPIAEARHGRFMIVPDIETLDDQLEGLPDDVVAFAFRRMVREFRIGRPLDDDDAAYRLHKQAPTIARMRCKHGEFLALVDGASGHARAKFLGRKSAQSSNFRRPKPQQNCQTAEPDARPSIEGQEEPVPSIEGERRAVAAPALEASAAPDAPQELGAATEATALEEEPRTGPSDDPLPADVEPIEPQFPDGWRPDDPDIDTDPIVAALYVRACDIARKLKIVPRDPADWWRHNKRRELAKLEAAQ